MNAGEFLLEALGFEFTVLELRLLGKVARYTLFCGRARAWFGLHPQQTFCLLTGMDKSQVSRVLERLARARVLRERPAGWYGLRPSSEWRVRPLVENSAALAELHRRLVAGPAQGDNGLVLEADLSDALLLPVDERSTQLTKDQLVDERSTGGVRGGLPQASSLTQDQVFVQKTSVKDKDPESTAYLGTAVDERSTQLTKDQLVDERSTGDEISGAVQRLRSLAVKSERLNDWYRYEHQWMELCTKRPKYVTGRLLACLKLMETEYMKKGQPIESPLAYMSQIARADGKWPKKGRSYEA